MRSAVAFSRRSGRFLLGHQAVARPHPRTPPAETLEALKPQFLLDPHRPVARMGKRMIEHGHLDLGRHPVGVGPRGPGSRSINPSAR